MLERNDRASQCLSSMLERNDRASQCLSSMLERNDRASQCLGSMLERNDRASQCLSSMLERNDRASQCLRSTTVLPRQGGGRALDAHAVFGCTSSAPCSSRPATCPMAPSAMRHGNYFTKACEGCTTGGVRGAAPASRGEGRVSHARMLIQATVLAGSSLTDFTLRHLRTITKRRHSHCRLHRVARHCTSVVRLTRSNKTTENLACEAATEQGPEQVGTSGALTSDGGDVCPLRSGPSGPPFCARCDGRGVSVQASDLRKTVLV